jgi:ATP-dependent protease ClpP protease subunit
MADVYLSKSIENENTSYIDDVINQIKSIDPSEPLRMLITSYGGSTDQGKRIIRAIREHEGKTEALIIGVAASMATSILPAFDEVSFDAPDTELMFHKSGVFDSYGERVPEEELDADIVDRLKRFNANTYSELVNAGMSDDFVSEVFLSDSLENFWITAEEAVGLGLGKIKPATPDAMKVAANYDQDIINLKNELKMNLFKKKALQVFNTADGRAVAFESASAEPKKGDQLKLVGSNEGLGSELMLSNTMKAILNEGGEIVNVEEVEEPKAEVSDEMVAELSARIDDLEAAVNAIKEAMNGEAEEAEEVEAKKDEEEEKMKALANKVESTLSEVENIANTLSTTAKLGKVEDKAEPLEIGGGLTEEQKQIAALHQISNMKIEEKIK